MEHKQGSDRNQMFMFCLESAIARDSFVRVVDAFVDAIDLESFEVPINSYSQRYALLN